MPPDSSDTPRFLPLALDVHGRTCLVVGGGAVGTRKALTLRRAGAEVTVVSPTITAELAALVEVGRLKWLSDSFREEHVGGVFLVVAATDNEAMNQSVVRAAVQSGALACDASSSERSQVIFPALLEGDDVTIAVFTDGRDPALARRTRDQIAALLPLRSKPDGSRDP